MQNISQNLISFFFIAFNHFQDSLLPGFRALIKSVLRLQLFIQEKINYKNQLFRLLWPDGLFGRRKRKNCYLNN